MWNDIKIGVAKKHELSKNNQLSVISKMKAPYQGKL